MSDCVEIFCCDGHSVIVRTSQLAELYAPVEQLAVSGWAIAYSLKHYEVEGGPWHFDDELQAIAAYESLSSKMLGRDKN